jgi:hypothetical protein
MHNKLLVMCFLVVVVRFRCTKNMHPLVVCLGGSVISLGCVVTWWIRVLGSPWGASSLVFHRGDGRLPSSATMFSVSTVCWCFQHTTLGGNQKMCPIPHMCLLFTRLPLYGSVNPEEFLDWQEQIEYGFELQDFSEEKNMLMIGGRSIHISTLSSVGKTWIKSCENNLFHMSMS